MVCSLVVSEVRLHNTSVWSASVQLSRTDNNQCDEERPEGYEDSHGIQ